MTSRISPILVPYDGSPLARAACDFAAFLAPARLVLALAVPVGDDESLADADVHRGDVAEGQSILAAGARRLPFAADTRVVEGTPALVLARTADTLDARLVVVGSRGRSPARGILLGSVARHLVVHLDRPVAVVHGVGAMSRIVAAVDGGPRDARIVEVARELSHATGAELSFVTVIDEDLDVVVRPEAYGIPSDVWRRRVSDQEARAFRDIGAEVARSTRMGIPADAIRQEAADRGADVVVVGRMGDGGVPVDGWFSVAYALAAVGPFTTVVV